MQSNRTQSTGLTVLTLAAGLGITLVMTAANLYLGLYAGMTVSASIPAAVAAMGLFALLRRPGLHESNLIQTMASAGESLAAGTLFTIPALVLVGAWNDFRFWPTTLIALAGGILGVVFMIPLRKVLIVDRTDLTYPEGVACAAVLRAGAQGTKKGLRSLATGVAAGAGTKVLSAGMGVTLGSIEWAWRAGRRVFFAGTDVSAALVGVGYIVGLNVAALVFIGGALGWLIIMPLLGGGGSGPTLDAAWGLWSGRVRYVGVGAMVVGGLWSIVSIRKGIGEGIRGLAFTGTHSTGGSDDIPRRVLAALGALCVVVILALYREVTGSTTVSILALLCMVAAAFLFSAVSSYITGLVGSSNNPVSGMTIAALLYAGISLKTGSIRGDVSTLLSTVVLAGVIALLAFPSRKKIP